MELKDFNITKAKLGVILMCVIVIIAASQLSPLFLSAGENTKEATANSYKPVKELSFDEFTIKDEAMNNSIPGNNMMSSVHASYNMGTPGLNQSADSLIYENDSTFTIEGIKDEMQNDGEWIKVTQAEVDPEGVVDNSGGFDSEINTDYVWRPRNVAAGWSPYTNGYWSYTNCGWMWVSYYSWGWRPYHYGRWWWSEYYGWVWSPGFIFAPAWVVWMYNDDYCGWYPISPRIRCHNYYGWRCHNMRYRVRHWNFCHKKDFANPLRPPVLIVDPMYNGGIIKTTKYDGTLTTTTVGIKGKGPDVRDIEKHAGVTLTKEDVTKYGTKNVTTTVNDVKKKNDEVRSVKDNESVNKTDGTKQQEIIPEVKGGTGKETGTEKKFDEKKHEEKLKDYEKQKDGEKQREYEKQQEINKQKEQEKQHQSDKQKQNEQKQKEPEKKKEYDKPKEKTKDSYTPPPQEKYTPPKENYEPPKDTYKPPKNDNPPKKDNPPPKKDTYNPPKNDDGNKGNNDKGSKR